MTALHLSAFERWQQPAWIQLNDLKETTYYEDVM